MSPVFLAQGTEIQRKSGMSEKFKNFEIEEIRETKISIFIIIKNILKEQKLYENMTLKKDR